MKKSELRQIIKEELETILKENTSEYYQSKHVVDNPDAYHESDVLRATAYLRGYQDGSRYGGKSTYTHKKIEDEYGNTDWRDTGEMGG